MLRRGSPLAALLLLGSLAVHAHAAEMLVRGKVLRVVPISARSQVVEQSGECDATKPGPSAGLVDLMTWDLRPDCRTTRSEVDVVTGYRVYYQWDGRVYNTVQRKPPADTIPLRVTVN